MREKSLPDEGSLILYKKETEKIELVARPEVPTERPVRASPALRFRQDDLCKREGARLVRGAKW